MMFPTSINNVGTSPLHDHIWNKIKIKPLASTKMTKYHPSLTNMSDYSSFVSDNSSLVNLI